MSRTSGKSDLVDLTVQLHHETGKAVLVSDDGDRDHAVWLPLSQVEIERKPNGVVIVTLPEWLATDKGLV
jgi:hypothetical protein